VSTPGCLRTRAGSSAWRLRSLPPAGSPLCVKTLCVASTSFFVEG